LAAITRPNVLPVAVAAAGWLAWRERGTGRRVARAAACLGAAALCVAPVTVENLRAEGQLVLIQANGGLNFHLANNPEADGVHYLRPGIEWRRVVREGEAAAPGGPADRDRYWMRRGLEWLAGHPGRGLALLAKRLVLFPTSGELDASQDAGWHRHTFLPLRAAPIDVPMLAPFLVAGAVLGVRRRLRPEATWGILLVAVYATSLLLFPYNSRYRYPSLPVFWALAGWAAVELWERGRRLSPRARAAALLATAAAVAATETAVLRLQPGSILRIDYQLGRVAYQRGDLADAFAHYDAALAARPGDPDVLNNLGIALEKAGRPDEARERYRQAIAAAPDHAEAWLNLAGLDRAAGRTEEAIDGFRTVVGIDPFEPAGWNALGALYAETGREEEALAAFRRAWDLNPRDPYPGLNLGRLLFRLRRPEEARPVYERLRSRRSTRVEGLVGLARIEAGYGRWARADALLAEALALEPGHQEAARVRRLLRERVSGGG
jgi:Flp pilus assembly protein TadD